MKAHNRLLVVFVSAALLLLFYVAGYLHFVHPMPIGTRTSGRETVEPVFQTAQHSLIRLFRPAVTIDRTLFPGRWELKRFQLPGTNINGLRQMPPFRARVESVGRMLPHNTGISTLRLGLRFESGHFLEIIEPGATEQMFSLAGTLMDSRLHDFPGSWSGAK